MDGKLVNQIVSWAFGCVNIMILIRHWYHKTSYRRRDRKFPFQSKAVSERFTRKWFHHHIYFHTIQTHLYEEFWTWLRFKTWGKNQWLIENFFKKLNVWLAVRYCQFPCRINVTFIPLFFAAVLLCVEDFRLTIEISEWSRVHVTSSVPQRI